MTKKKKFKHDYGLKHLFLFYRDKYENPVDYKVFSTVINLFNNKLINEVYRGAYISLPYTLGDLFIYKYKPKLKFDEQGNVITHNRYMMIDYKATKELWKDHPELEHKQKICYDNFHTDGFKFAISWKRYHTRRLHKLYNFIPSRSFRRGLATYLFSHPNQDYYDK